MISWNFGTGKRRDSIDAGGIPRHCPGNVRNGLCRNRLHNSSPSFRAGFCRASLQNLVNNEMEGSHLKNHTLSNLGRCGRPFEGAIKFFPSGRETFYGFFPSLKER